jgi:hypothetical protein
MREGSVKTKIPSIAPEKEEGRGKNGREGEKEGRGGEGERQCKVPKYRQKHPQKKRREDIQQSPCQK